MSFFIIDQVGYELESKTLFRNMTTTPDSARKRIINDLIKGLKADGIWNLLDALWLMAAHDQQGARLNWKLPGTYTLIEVNSPTWGTNGYTGNGTSMYLDSNFNPATQGVNYTQNSASFGVYSRTNAGFTGDTELGLAIALNYTVVLQIRRNTDLAAFAINNDANIATVANTIGLGLFSVARLSSSDSRMYRNGVEISSSTISSAAMDSATINILARKIGGGGADSYSERQLAMAYIGGGGIDQSKFYTRIQNYMTSIGSQV